MRDNTVLCKKKILDRLSNTRFKAGRRYKIVYNYNRFVGVVDEMGFKANLFKKPENEETERLLNLISSNGERIYLEEHFTDTDYLYIEDNIDRMY